MVNDYASFLASKAPRAQATGTAPQPMPGHLKPFQGAATAFCVRQGRAALFEDTGLGKTRQELEWARQCGEASNGRALILTPLAVARQFEREALLLGYQARVIRSQDDAGPGINICNYDRLGLLRTEAFGAVALDECFAKGTMIDTPSGPKHIEDMRVGDYILNCVGIDQVSDTHRREVPYGVLVKISGTSVIASPNHPIFTQRGWVGAQHLRAGDHALATRASVRLVRSDLCAEVFGAVRSEILRDILLSEMADDTEGSVGESSFSGGRGEAGCEKTCMAGLGATGGVGGTRADYQAQSIYPTRSSGEDFSDVESHEACTIRAWGQWSRDDIAASVDDGCSWSELGSGISVITGPKEARIPNMLQGGLRQSEFENRNRGGWSFPFRGEGGAGLETRCDDCFARVDGIEILEPGDSRLEQFRSSDGKLYFYDLGATRHPSYSVQGFLVHNSSILKSFTGATTRALIAFLEPHRFRLAATATPAPNDHMELGQHAEALGIMPSNEMLMRWFIADQTQMGRYRLKAHGEADFWDWMVSWSRMARMPSDLGDSDDGYLLPEMVVTRHRVAGDTRAPAGALFVEDLSATHVHSVKRQTAEARAAAIFNIIMGDSWRGSLSMPNGGASNIRPMPTSEQSASNKRDLGPNEPNICGPTALPISTNGKKRQNNGQQSTPAGANDTDPTPNIARRSKNNPAKGKTQSESAPDAFNNSLESARPNTTLFSQSSGEDAPFAELPPATNADGDCTSTIATPADASEVFSVQIATSALGSSGIIPIFSCQQRPTSGPDEFWVIWCDTDYEQDALDRLFGDIAVSIRGSMTANQKEYLHDKWLNGERKVLITKGSIFGYGMNWQHCCKMAFVGRSFSYESWYQAVRRCWRFGQTRPVHVHLAVAEGEEQIGRVIDRKATDHQRMQQAMAMAMRRERNVEAAREAYQPHHIAELPSWIRSVA